MATTEPINGIKDHGNVPSSGFPVVREIHETLHQQVARKDKFPVIRRIRSSSERRRGFCDGKSVFISDRKFFQTTGKLDSTPLPISGCKTVVSELIRRNKTHRTSILRVVIA